MTSIARQACIGFSGWIMGSTALVAFGLWRDDAFGALAAAFGAVSCVVWCLCVVLLATEPPERR